MCFLGIVLLRVRHIARRVIRAIVECFSCIAINRKVPRDGGEVAFHVAAR